MPINITNRTAHQANIARQKDPLSKYDELVPTIQEYVKNTNHLFYYNLEECRIGLSSAGNIEVCYQGTDVDGKQHTIYVEILEGSLRLRNIKKMCNGIDMRTGAPIPISPDNAYVQFRSAVTLFLTDLESWSNKHGIPVDYITFPPQTRKIKFLHEKPSKFTEGEVALWYKYTGDFTYGD